MQLLALARLTSGWTLCRRDRTLDEWHDYRDLLFRLYPLRGKLAGHGYVLEAVDRHGRLVRRRVGVATPPHGIEVLEVRDAVKALRRVLKGSRCVPHASRASLDDTVTARHLGSGGRA